MLGQIGQIALGGNFDNPVSCKHNCLFVYCSELIGVLHHNYFSNESSLNYVNSSGGLLDIWSRRLGFDSESGQTNHFKIGIHRLPA